MGRGKKGRKNEGKAIILLMYKIKKMFFKGKIAEECQVDIPEVKKS